MNMKIFFAMALCVVAVTASDEDDGYTTPPPPADTDRNFSYRRRSRGCAPSKRHSTTTHDQAVDDIMDYEDGMMAHQAIESALSAINRETVFREEYQDPKQRDQLSPTAKI